MSLSKLVYPTGVRFCPTEEEIFYYLRIKNLESNTSHVDQVISTLNISTSDPWHLPSKATVIVETTDLVWYFFGLIETKYNKGVRQSRQTQSGFWKKTGETMDIKRKSGDGGQKIGEKRVLMFYLKSGLKSKWTMHEYHATIPDQVMTYTLCKVEFKGEKREIEESRSLYPAPMGNNIIGGLIENPSKITGSPLDMDALDQSKDVYMEEYNRYEPKKPLTGFIDDSSDSDSTSPTTSSIQTWSTCDSSNQIPTDLQESPTSTIKETPEKKKKTCDDDALVMIKNKRAGFFGRMLQKFAKKIQLCFSI